VLAYARKTGLLQAIEEDHIFPTLDLAVRQAETLVGLPPGANNLPNDR
jgi:hypothetical protein